MSEDNAGLSGLPYTVIRIRAGDAINFNAVHSGTGFFYTYHDNGKDIPFIISNKHVLCGKTWIDFDFATTDKNGKRVFGPSAEIRMNQGDLPIIEHPDPSVDLAGIPMKPLLDSLNTGGIRPYVSTLTKANSAPANVQAVLHAATSVLMVGFPNGIMDEANNLPVVRRGTLATHYKADYRGETNFVVDIAAFGGSSGSPVFSFFENILPDENGNISFMARPQIHLIGVLHSGPVVTAQGNIVGRLRARFKSSRAD